MALELRIAIVFGPEEIEDFDLVDKPPSLNFDLIGVIIQVEKAKLLTASLRLSTANDLDQVCTHITDLVAAAQPVPKPNKVISRMWDRRAIAQLESKAEVSPS